MPCCPDLPNIEIDFVWQIRGRMHYLDFHDNAVWGEWSDWGSETADEFSSLLGSEQSSSYFGIFTRDLLSVTDPEQQEMRFFLRHQPSPTCYLKVVPRLVWQRPPAEGIDHFEELPPILWEHEGTRDVPCYPEGFQNSEKSTWPTSPDHGDGTQDENWIYLPAPGETNYINLRQILWTVVIGR